VTGAFDRVGSAIRLRAWITDARRGGRIWEVAPVTTQGQTFAQSVDSVRLRIAGGIAVLHDQRFADLLPIASAPPQLAAFQEFLEGLTLRRQGQIIEALQHFRWATGIDTTFTWPLVYGALAGLYWYRANMTVEVDSFLTALGRVRDGLPTLQRRLFDHVAAVRAEDWDAAYAAMRAAAQLAPREYGFMLANTALARNRPRDALEALTRSGVDSIHRTNIQGYWYDLTLALHRLGEHRRELGKARLARGVDPRSAHALYQEIVALVALGHLVPVQARLDTLVALPFEGWFTAPVALEMVATELRAHGHHDMAARVFARAIDWHHARPVAERATQMRREHLATLLYKSERWSDADTLFRALAREHATSYGYPDQVYYVGHLGLIAARRGDRSVAVAIAAQLRTMERAQALPGQEALVFRARIAALLGEKEEAISLLIAAYGSSGSAELHGDNDFLVMLPYAPFVRLLEPKG
jgi:tetratricopeptide (TPR) repeat protein